MHQPTARAPIRCSQWSHTNSSSPATDGQGQHPATPTISPPPEYTSREGSSPRSDQDSIEAINSSNASSCEKYPTCEHKWDGKLDEKFTDEKPAEKSLKPKKVKKQTAEREPIGVQIWLTILQLPQKDHRVWLVVVFLVVLICVLFSILWFEAYHAGSHGATANATSTVTVTRSEPTMTSVVTKTTAMTVLSIFATTTVSSSHTPTSTTTIPSPLPTRIGGFAAIEYEDWFGDLSTSLFWVDDHGVIKRLDSDSSTTSGWNDAGTFASDVRVGSAVCHVYESYSNYDGLYFVDDDYIIHDYYYDYDWEKGTISSLGLKTSESMNFMVCAPNSVVSDWTNKLAEIYVFYNSTDGRVHVAELSNGQWLSLPDVPFYGSAAFVGCDSDYYGNLLAYVVNEKGQLEQWSLKKDLASPWTLDLQHDGPYSPHTLIYSVIASKNSEGRSHIFLQNPENTIIRLDTHGLGTNTTIVGKAEIAHAVAGTRMTASGDCNSTVILYYQANSTEMWEYSMVDDALNNAVVVLGTGPVQSGLPFGSGGAKVMTYLDTMLILCLVSALNLFC